MRASKRWAVIKPVIGPGPSFRTVSSEPYRFTLTCVTPEGVAIGGLFSVALS
jgi:hypothetical protein